jgi:hypothetical protein
MFSLTKIVANCCLTACFAVALPALASVDGSAAEACLEQAASDLAQGTGSAKRLLDRDFSRCVHLPSMDVKQACSNVAFADYEHRLEVLRAEHSANIQACLH